MKTSLISIVSLIIGAAFATPTLKQRAGTPTVVAPSPDATFQGLTVGVAESFQGIPFAQPPVGGSLRLNKPLAMPQNESLGTRSALLRGPACPQDLIQTDFEQNLPAAALGVLLNTPLFQELGNVDEDCLYLNVYRPAGTTPEDKLPVLFWMHGGGFEMGFTMDQEGVPFVTDSISQGKPIVFVAATYRTGGFGFLAGKEVLEAGVANLGLLDQRRAMEWVADNIASFGGDPDKVTIWGESAGAISVFDHLILYDGDHTYNGKPLFRAGIMNSGSLVPADPVDCDKAQVVYDHIVSETASCASATDTLQCLREADYQDLLNAITSLPTFTGYQSIALRFLPRPDGQGGTISDSPEKLIKAGKFAQVPVIIGDEEDEGTLWALMQPNITTTSQVADYLNEYFFHHASASDMDDFVATYQTITEDGSPFRTGLLNNWYPQFKRLAAILGDLAFSLSRRYFLSLRREYNSAAGAGSGSGDGDGTQQKAWSYMSSYFYGTPILGTVHGSDIFHIVWSVPYDYATRTMHSYYLSFIYDMDPNSDNDAPEWPEWTGDESDKKEILNLFATFQQFISDDYRADSYQWIVDHIPQLTM